MKRSQMVEIIAEELLSVRGLFGGASDEWEPRREETKLSRLKIAHYALAIAERQGMLPPCFANFGGHVKEDWKDNRCDDYVESCNNNWESEDEKNRND